MNEDEISTEAIKCSTKNLNIHSNQLDSDRGPSMVGKSVHPTALSNYQVTREGSISAICKQRFNAAS